MAHRAGQRHLGQHLAGLRAALPGLGIGRGQRRSGVGHGGGLARVDQLGDVAVLGGQRQHRFAQHVEAARRRRHELGAAPRALGIDVEGLHALGAVAVEQRLGTALHHGGQLPGQVVGVVQAGVQTAHAEDRHRMRGIAGKEHAAVAVALQRHRAGAVDRGPGRLPRQVAFADGVQVALHEGAHVLRLHRLFGAVAVAQLPVDAPQVVGLAVHQHRGAAVPGRVEPGAALGRVRAGQGDVDDDVAAGVGRAFQRQAQRVAHEALAAVAGHHPVGLQAAAAQRVAQAQGHALRLRLDRVHRGGPADGDAAGRFARWRGPPRHAARPRCSTAAG